MNAISSNQENTTLIVLISAVATLGGFLFGFDSGVINGTVDGLQQAFGSSKAGLGFEVASMLLGCAVGAFFAGRLSDRWGPRGVLIVAGILFLISAIGAGAALSSWMFISARVLGGFAVGAASVISPAYISEVAPARYRGRLVTVQQIAIICGLTAAFLSNYLLAQMAGTSTQALWLGQLAWRWMFWMQVIPSSLFLLLLLLIPESPRYLVVKRRYDEARAVLHRLFGMDRAREMLDEISASLSSDHRPRLSDLFQPGTRRVRPIVWVGAGLAALQQPVGISAVFYYGAVLWQAVGFSENDALLINLLSGTLSIGACLLTVLMIERFGRKRLLWAGSIGMAITLALVAFAFASGTLVDGQLQLPGQMGILALIAANAYVVCFNMTWGPVLWVMLGEMFPNQIRGSALAVTGGAHWVSNFTITLSFPILLAGIGLAAAYGIYLAFAIISIVFVLKYVYETKGRELEQMEG